MDDESSIGTLKCNDKCSIDGADDTKLVAQEARSRDTRKLSTAVGFCLLFMVVEVAGGIKANSLAILTDAAHLLSDIAGFAISIFSIWASGWEANPRQTFGYYRAEILGALLSIQIIWLVTGVLVYEAIVRFIHPDTNINGKIMFIIACIGLGMNIILMVTLSHHGHDHSHGGHSHGHHHGGHDHSNASHAHNEHKDHAKHSKAYGHDKEKPNICKRLASVFRKQKRHCSHHHKTPREHEPNKAGNHDNEAHEKVLVCIEHEDERQEEPHHGDNEVHEIHVDDHKVEPHDVDHEDHKVEPHDVDHEDHKVEPHDADHEDQKVEPHDADQEDHEPLFTVQADRRRSVKVDVNLSTLHEGEKAEGSINVRGAYLHALGDLIQSLGVLVAGAVIWVYPNLYVIDPICTLVFSVIVLATTYNMIREVVGVLMESTPREIDASALEKGLLALTSVVAVHELHIWAITVGRSLLACHILVDPEADTQDVLHKVTEYCEKVYKISHVTIQVERDL